GTALRSPDWAAQLVRGGAVACNTSISVVVSILLLGIDYFDVVLHSMGNRLRGLLGAASWTSTFTARPAYYTLIGQLAMQELSYDSDRV
ncbi:hypothetical protein PoMZ_11534, partial [Pyricularia oryzae]